MKKISLFLIFTLILSTFIGCNEGGEKNKFQYKYNPPATIITVEQYRQKIDELCSYESYSTADSTYLQKLDAITNNLRDMIVYSSDTATFSGT